jgi:hypothetical protein
MLARSSASARRRPPLDACRAPPRSTSIRDCATPSAREIQAGHARWKPAPERTPTGSGPSVADFDGTPRPPSIAGGFGEGRRRRPEPRHCVDPATSGRCGSRMHQAKSARFCRSARARVRGRSRTKRRFVHGAASRGACTAVPPDEAAVQRWHPGSQHDHHRHFCGKAWMSGLTRADSHHSGSYPAAVK